MYYFSTYVKQLRDIRKYNCVFEYWDANILQVACVPYKFVCKIKKNSYRVYHIFICIFVHVRKKTILFVRSMPTGLLELACFYVGSEQTQIFFF